MRAAILIATALLLAAAPPTASATHVPDEEIKWGCPGPDCIPAITDPAFTDTPYLKDDELVVGVEVNGDARAYPVKVLDWHEIVDDEVGGKPVAITYCPLCGSAIAYDREVDDKVLTFRVSGRLYKNDLVMYDPETNTLWAQILGEGIKGPLHGVKLGTESTSLLEWGEWKSTHPNTKLLALPDTYPASTYDRYPYGDYKENRQIGISGKSRDDVGGLHPKAFVAGVEVGGAARAYPYAVLAGLRVVNDTIGDKNVLVTVVGGEVNAFLRDDLRFEWGPEDGLVLDQFGRIWDAREGKAVAGGAELERIAALPMFWFAWYDFHPDTTILNATGEVVDAPEKPRDTPFGGPLSLGVGGLIALGWLFLAKRRRKP